MGFLMVKMKKFSFLTKLLVVLCVLLIFMALSRLLTGGPGGSVVSSAVRPGVILAMNLKGILLDNKKFLENLRKYSARPRIKGVLVRLNSPGGSVAASQELYSEFKRIKEQLKKPVVVSVADVMASGALLAAAGASQILVHSGSLVGSIGVIKHSMNMEKLYEFAKVQPYSIKTGEFKDLAPPYREITSRERELVQDLLGELLNQFKQALVEGRNLTVEELDPYTDARVFTGETAVSAGFADSIGSYSDAIELVGELSGLGKTPHLFTPEPGYWERFSQSFGGGVLGVFKNFLTHYRLSKTPLYILPSAVWF